MIPTSTRDASHAGFLALFGFILALFTLVLPLLWVASRACACGQLRKTATPPTGKRLAVAVALFAAAASCCVGGGAGVMASAPKILCVGP